MSTSTTQKSMHLLIGEGSYGGGSYGDYDDGFYSSNIAAASYSGAKGYATSMGGQYAGQAASTPGGYNSTVGQGANPDTILNAGEITIIGQKDPQATGASLEGGSWDGQGHYIGWVQYTINGVVVSTIQSRGHPTRDNNPIDIIYGKWATNHGAVNGDKGFAIFPTQAAGYAAAEALIQSKANTAPKFGQYGATGTLGAVISILSPPVNSKGVVQNNTADMVSKISAWSGISANTQISTLNTTQLQSLVAAYGKYEGFTPH